MVAYDDIAQIELRRLAELEKQAATYGPSTEPAVLIEIQELRHKHGTSPGRFVRPAGQRDKQIDVDYLVNMVAGMFRRLIAIEDRNTKEDATRPRRQMVLNIWLGAISALVILSIVLQLWFINRLFGT